MQKLDLKKRILDEEKAEKAKRGIKRAIYGRTLFIVLLILFQVGLYLFLSLRLAEYSILINAGFILLATAVSVHIISNEGDAYFKIAWLIPIIISPAIGAVFYIIFHTQSGAKRFHARIENNAKQTWKYLPQDEVALEDLSKVNSSACGLANYTFNSSNYPVYQNCDFEFFKLGDDWFPAIMREMEQAKDFIFLEFFIISFGRVWGDILELLKRKAEEGVDVRLMYDGFNTLSSIPYDYHETLESYGIKCKVFSPMKPLLSTVQNNRDHRKILVVDGRVAFTGGNNLADEYINEKLRFGHWKDTSIMVRGEATKTFTMMFLRMWNSFGERENDFERFIYKGDFGIKEGKGYVIPYGDCPFNKERVGEYVYLDILYNAKKYVHIMSPYLVINDSLRTALIHTARRGVDVKLILPHIPDKAYAFCVARTYYPELLKFGVKIYEYTPGFLHAKQFICDDKVCTVGSVNLDFRGLFLHFECGTIVFDEDFTREVEADFEATIEKSQEMTIADYNKLSAVYRITGKVLRVAGPLL